MKNKENTIYDALFLDELEQNGVQFGWRDKSKKSKSFLIPFLKDKDGKVNTSILKEYIKTAFGISDAETFTEKYRQAITGSGNASKDFDALKSSALCALLCFYRIKDLKIDDVIYDQSYFEVKNLVIGTPSNMDVVLIGKDKQGKRVILFLECKFSEYLKNDVQSVSKDYFSGKGKIYFDAIKNSRLGSYSTVDGKHYNFFTERAYSQGTKQVISHLLGIESFLNRDDSYALSVYPAKMGEESRRGIYKGEYDRVLFRELLFRFGSPDNDHLLNEYIKLSNDVRDQFKNLIPDKLEFQEPITYQEIFSSANLGNIDPIVAHFYGFSAKD